MICAKGIWDEVVENFASFNSMVCAKGIWDKEVENFASFNPLVKEKKKHIVPKLYC